METINGPQNKSIFYLNIYCLNICIQKKLANLCFRIPENLHDLMGEKRLLKHDKMY